MERVQLGVAVLRQPRRERQGDAHLHVLHAEDPMLASAARSTGVDLAAETRSELGAFMQSAFPAGDWAPQHHVIAGVAVDVIRDTAERESADLIVVGARGMSGVERMFFGSTTEGVLRQADTSVLVVPASWKPPRPELNDLTGTGPIVVGVELSPPAIAAARAAGTLAAILGTSAEAIHVVPPLPVPARWSHHAEQAQAARIHSAKTDVALALQHVEGVTVVGVETGPVPESLAEAVVNTRDRHPLLVLGRRTHKERGGAPGSTAFRVLALTQAPVLMYLPDR